MIKKREGNSILQQQVPGWVMNQMPAAKGMYCFSLVFWLHDKLRTVGSLLSSSSQISSILE